MKKCTYCNAQIDDAATQCEYCGMAVKETVMDIQPTIQSAPVVKKRRKNSWWSIVLSILLSVCLFFSLFTGVAFTLVRQSTNGGLVKAVTKDVNILDVPLTADGATLADMVADALNGTVSKKDDSGVSDEVSPDVKGASGTQAEIVEASDSFSVVTDGEIEIGETYFIDESGNIVDSEGNVVEGATIVGDDFSFDEDGNIVVGGLDFDFDLSGLEDLFTEMAGEDGVFSADEIKQLAEQLGLSEVLEEIMNQATGVLTGGEVNFDSEMIMGTVSKNKGTIEQALGITITDEHMAKAKEVLDRELVTVNQQINQVVAKPEMQVTLKTVSFVVGPVIPIIAYCISGFILLLILLLLRRKETTFMFAGVTSLLVGLTFLVAFLCSDIIADFVLAYIQAMAGASAVTYNALAQTVIKAVIDPMLTASLIVMGAGALCIALYVLLRVLIGKSKKYAK